MDLDIQSNFTSQKLTEKDFKRLSVFIQDELGIKMPPAKKVMLESRLQKRLKTLGINSFEKYCDFIFAKEGENELIHMIDCVTTNKTDFFREPAHFDYLQNVLLPRETREADWGMRDVFKIWSTASSTGEEPYTLAMVMKHFQEKTPGFRFSVFATDISTRVLEHAVKAIYEEEKVAPVPLEYRKKYLLRSKEKTQHLVRIKPEVRHHVSFARLNLIDSFRLRDVFEVIFCRNVIIYFDRKDQEQLIHKLYDHLRPGGYLFLGHSETLCGIDIPLKTVAPTIYKKLAKE